MSERERLILELLSDDHFVQWVQSPDEQSNAYWQHWIAQQYERQEIVQEARKVIKSLNFDTASLSDAQKGSLKERIKQSLEKKPDLSSRITTPLSQPKPGPSIVYRSLKYAAAIAILFVFGYFLINSFPLIQNKIAVSTTFGETSSISLPDGSVVTLNANSKLEYEQHWEEEEAREVWLQGEAFFEVQKADEIGGREFIVHTDQLNVEVLGTSFNVNNRRGKTQVVLNTGSVKLKTLQANTKENVLMKPGDLVEFSTDQGVFIKKAVVDPEMYSSWRANIMKLEDVPLTEIAQKIEDYFGYKVHIETDSLKKEKVTTTLFNNDLGKSCELLETMLPWLEITTKEQHIIMRAK